MKKRAKGRPTKGLTPHNFRIATSLLTAIDAELELLNARRFHPLNRSDLMREILESWVLQRQQEREEIKAAATR